MRITHTSERCHHPLPIHQLASAPIRPTSACVLLTSTPADSLHTRARLAGGPSVRSPPPLPSSPSAVLHRRAQASTVSNADTADASCVAAVEKSDSGADRNAKTVASAATTRFLATARAREKRGCPASSALAVARDAAPPAAAAAPDEPAGDGTAAAGVAPTTTTPDGTGCHAGAGGSATAAPASTRSSGSSPRKVAPSTGAPATPRFRPRLVVPGPTDGVCTPPHPPCGWPPRRRSGVERPRAGAGHGGARATCRPPCPAQLPPLYAAHPCPLVPATVVHALPVDRFRRLGWSVLFAFKGPSPLAAFLLPPPSPFSLSPCPSFSTTASRRLA